MISVIIPMYNVEEYIGECLDSLVHQTYDDFEVLIVDDGSKDKSTEIAHQYAAIFRDKDIHFEITSIENSGQSYARNLGLSKAKGEFVYFLDSDDYISVELFDKAMKSFKENDIEMVLFDAKAFNTDLPEEEFQYYDYLRGIRSGLYNSQDFFCRSITEGKFIVQPCCFIYRRETYKDISFINYRIYEDNSFATEILTSTAQNVMVLEEMLFFRRARSNSTVTSHARKKDVEDYLKNINYIHELTTLHSGHLEKCIREFNSSLMISAARQMYFYHNKSIPLKQRKRIIDLSRKYGFSPLCILYILMPNLIEWVKWGVYDKWLSRR
ncbi:glycosyltransferase [Vibrio sp.]|nr:glycosyltransferase [Vibrio sp.]